MLIHWLWYATLEQMSTREKSALLQHFGDVEDIYNADEQALSQAEGLTQAGAALLLNKDLSTAERILAQCRDGQIDLITLADPKYPDRLKSINDPPLVLYYQGQLPDFDALPAIGVVGTRKATPFGLEMAQKMGYEIACCGGLVISGGAAGIDTCALHGALAAGKSAVAVFGCGLDVIYPPSNRKLFADISRCGCLISEYPPGTPPYKWHFPVRNRILSGLSRGVLVVEAPERSGALITARRAREQGRDVFVVTGNAGTASCSGSNALLRKGGIYAECGWDVLCEYEHEFPGVIRRDMQQLPQAKMEKIVAQEVQKPDLPRKKAVLKQKSNKKVVDKKPLSTYSDSSKALPSLSEVEQKVFAAVRGDCAVDDVVAATGLSAGAVLATLTLLEMKGLVTGLPGRRVCRNDGR